MQLLHFVWIEFDDWLNLLFKKGANEWWGQFKNNVWGHEWVLVNSSRCFYSPFKSNSLSSHLNINSISHFLTLVMYNNSSLVSNKQQLSDLINNKFSLFITLCVYVMTTNPIKQQGKFNFILISEKFNLQNLQVLKTLVEMKKNLHFSRIKLADVEIEIEI